jgi:hypothetical protein
MDEMKERVVLSPIDEYDGMEKLIVICVGLDTGIQGTLCTSPILPLTPYTSCIPFTLITDCSNRQ